jgi:acyl-homoserine-lactone acylase
MHRLRRRFPRALLLLPLGLLGCSFGAQAVPSAGDPAGANEILWDHYGVPHIYAADPHALFRGYGWAQAHAHGDLLLRVIGEARGRSAEYWGTEGLARDRWYWTYGVPQTGARLYEQADGRIRRLVDAFADGINGYASDHRDRIDEASAMVLPVNGEDIYRMMAVLDASFSPAHQAGQQWGQRGSNAWAIAPSKSASGSAMLLANPHLPWTDPMTWFEAHLVAPGIDIHGASLIGLPVIMVGFNDRLGWTHTVSTADVEDLYELVVEGDGYLWDGTTRPFAADTVVLQVREAGSGVRPDTLVVLRSVHGPVIATREGEALAVRSAGALTGGRAYEQWWAMGRATDLDAFTDALRMHQLIGFTTTYADRDGNILHEYGGVVPERPGGDYAFWSRPVRGDTSATLWTSLHPYEDMPRVLNPPAGWVQNANEPVWWATFPPALSPDDYPAYFGPRHMHFRAQRSVRMLDESGPISFDEMIRLKYSTRLELADRIVPDLVAAGRAAGGDAAAAASTLESWDRSADADSRGAVLFQEWVTQALRSHGQTGMFARRWSMEEPRTTPAGLRDPELSATALAAAAGVVRELHGDLDVPWGDVYRLRRDTVDLPAIGASGGLGAFTVIGYGRMEDGRAAAMGGDGFVAAVEFGDPVRARTVLVYGNASQPGSPHRTDQIGLFAAKTLKPVWRTRAEVEANLRERTTF